MFFYLVDLIFMGLNGDIRLRVSLYDIDFICVNKIVVVLLFEWFM